MSASVPRRPSGISERACDLNSGGKDSNEGVRIAPGLRTLLGDRGFSDFVSRRFPSDTRTEALHNRLCDVVERARTRAQNAGAVRPDVTNADLVMLLWASSKIAEATGEVAPRAWRRNLYVALDGLRSGHDLPEPPLDDEQLYQVMARLKSRAGTPGEVRA